MPFVDRGFPVDVTFSSCHINQQGTVGRREKERQERRTALGQLILEKARWSATFSKGHHLSPGGLPLPKLNFQPHPNRFQVRQEVVVVVGARNGWIQMVPRKGGGADQ
jgi:hypothetical protein